MILSFRLVFSRMGKVYLVGAGPGDPELLSLKAYKLLQEADVILADYLILGVRKMIPPGKKVIEVGKSGKDDGKKTSQHEINRLMAELARKYDKVVRLKGGDPFIFGRGGEEAEFLSKNGIDFEVVPGISTATAVPAYFGIPLTHREYSSSLTIITGHEKHISDHEMQTKMAPTRQAQTQTQAQAQTQTKTQTKAKTEASGGGVNWSAVAALGGTIVMLMGVKMMERNVKRLLDEGMPAETPVAILEKGFTEEARAIIGTLGDIVEKAREAHVEPPAVIVIGDVVKLRDILGHSSQNCSLKSSH